MVTGSHPPSGDDLVRYLRTFNGPDNLATISEDVTHGQCTTKKFTNEFWTSRQRQAAPIHEVSYRACFKPQLPRFFIDLLSRKGDTVYDPFSGRVRRSSKQGFWAAT